MRNNFYFRSIIVFVCLVFITKCIETEKSDYLFTADEEKDLYNINITLENILVIKLKGNPSTGYGWFLDALNPNSSKRITKSSLLPLNLDEHSSTSDYIQDKAPENYMGVPGYYYFKFEAVEESENNKLEFIYKRPWETDIYRTVTFNIDISNKNKN